jgi:serine/threonine protein phosphatase PrpC
VLARYTGVTDPGRRRRRNEDAYVCEPPLFAIADGMGGAQAGEVASGLAAAVLEEATGDVQRNEHGEERLASLIQEANRRVFRRSNEDAATSGMGTTMTVALVDDSDGTIAFGHVGDSRAYRIRGGELEQLTDDHSLVGELVRSGRLSPEEAETHPQRSVITRALGTEPDVDVDTFTTKAEPQDIYVLCSDGLTDMISPHEILAIVERSRDLDDAARALIEAANAGGGEDNITVVLFEIDGNGRPDAAETARMPAAVPTPPDDDEDTLSPLDAVPAVDTAVIPAEALREHLEGAEPERPRRPEPRRRILPLVLLILILVALVALAVWGLTR